MSKYTAKLITLGLMIAAIVLVGCDPFISAGSDLTDTSAARAYVKQAFTSSQVTASSDDGNVPANTIDGSLSTRWSASGDGQWIQYDCATTRLIGYVKIAFYNGSARTSTFDVVVYDAGLTNPRTLLSRQVSALNTTLQTFNFADTNARYVRIVGHGNSLNLWNSYTEVEVWTSDPTVVTPTPTSTVSQYVLQAYDGKYAKFNTSGNLATTESTTSTAVKFIKIASGTGYKWQIAGSSNYLSVSSSRIVSGTTQSVYTETDAGSGWLYITSGSRFKDMADEVGVNSTSSENVNKYKLVLVSGTVTPTPTTVTPTPTTITPTPVTPTPATPTPGTLSPMQLLNTKAWKLTAWSGTTTLSLKEYFIGGSPDLWTYSDSRWFYTDQTWTYFKSYAGYPTTDGSSNPRSELRQMSSTGADEIYWSLATTTAYKMRWKVKVTQLPGSGKVCFGQIHGKEGLKDSSGYEYDDIIRIQVRGTANATSGTGTLYVMGYVVKDSADDVGSYTIGSELDLEIVAQNKTVTLNRVNADGTRTQLKQYTNIGCTANYFKAGNYMQSTTTGSAITAIRLLTLTP